MDKNSFLQQKCGYCHTLLDGLKIRSEWGEKEDLHYKAFNCCECNKKTWLKLDFEGSGHDSLAEEDVGELESMVSKVKGA